ncbi:MAG TPA: hypothetical protein VGG42_18835 [Acidobacteriaceae bacterium]|jgi:hypothetical protein
MIAEAIREIATLTRNADDAQLTEVLTLPWKGADVAYEFKVKPTAQGRELGDCIRPFHPQTLNVTTLTGFLDAIGAGVGSVPQPVDPAVPSYPSAPQPPPMPLVHVEDYLTVTLKSAQSDRWGSRDIFLTAKHPAHNAFTFDDYYADPAKFIIGLQTSFLATDELLYLIRLASNLKAGNSVQTEDDGFSQTITLKAGEVQTAEVKVQPKIRLIPLRTFPEVNAVENEFLIRFRQTPQQTPAIALFNTEGEKWKGDTMRSIKKYLVENLPAGVPVLA